MKTAAILFGLAALGGLTLAILRLSGTEIPPTWMAIGHGIVAVTALGTLIYAAAQHGLPSWGKGALTFFILAAAGGLFMFLNYHMADQPLPIPLVLLHGGLAITGFSLLITALAPRWAHATMGRRR